jgi:hypothetical protein
MNKKRKKGVGKKYDVYKAVLKLFKKNPNKLFQLLEIRRAMPIYDDSQIYMNVRRLAYEGKVNKEYISGRYYFWLTR